MFATKTISPELDAIDTYFDRYLPVIKQTMSVIARQRYEEADRHWDDGERVVDESLFFDPTRRVLSEMEICDFLLRFKYDIGYPKGYSLVLLGSVKSVYSHYIAPHMYMQREDDIICCTPGQFVKPNDLTMLRGERIGILEERARDVRSPELLRQVSDELWVLSGNRHEIASKLNLSYD